jgi:hypothetical protein
LEHQADKLDKKTAHQEQKEQMAGGMRNVADKLEHK